MVKATKIQFRTGLRSGQNPASVDWVKAYVLAQLKNCGCG